MEPLFALFPKDDSTLLAFIVLLPLIGAFVNGVFGKRLGREAVTLMGLMSIFGSFILSVAAFQMLRQLQTDTPEAAARLAWKGWEWVQLSLATPTASEVTISVGLSLDALSGTMALVVTGVGFLIHLYSWKYMEEDPGYHRFFSYLNLFIFSMLVLILGDSLPVLFVGWEGVGLCSYLLIGFWFEDEANAAAGKKAFIANRVGDFGLLVAMGLLLYYTGALDWQGIEGGKEHLFRAVTIFPDHIGSVQLKSLPLIGQFLPFQASAAALVGLALFLGCAGKSAQIPLYVWLPDAMAGPTPVSALIHAATMVTAGVYLVCRLSMVFVLSPFAMLTVAFIGAATALLAATIAFAQNDIKKVLAYSTVSQLGYMFLGVGVGAFTAGFFHVVTHAFFKACLFLGAGSVIHAMHARIHDSEKSQDMRYMGGLRAHLPYTYWTFAFAWAAIVGFPLTSGFFSKDAILVAAHTSSIKQAYEGIAGKGGTVVKLTEWPEWAGTALYAMGLAGAVMTAFYMTRLILGIFWGDFKGWKIVKKWKDPGHGHDHDHDAKKLDGPVPHESPWQMYVPLVILGALSLVAGGLNAHLGHLFHTDTFEKWLEPVFKGARTLVQVKEPESDMPYIGAAIAAFVAGVGGAYWVYVEKKGEPAREFAKSWPGLYALVRDKWRVDEFYEETFVGAIDTLAVAATWVDKWIVDGIVARFTSFLVAIFGTVLRYLQAGRVQVYALAMVVGLGAFGVYFFLPSADARVIPDAEPGKYSVRASPGLGYTYRWDENGDGKWEGDFGGKTEVAFELKPNETRKVRLEVKNAFGGTSERLIPVRRPKIDASGATPAEQAKIDAARARPLRPPPGTPGAPSGVGEPRPLVPPRDAPRVMPPDKVGP
jgi:NADH-quinone oxidoreductase subunit L